MTRPPMGDPARVDPMALEWWVTAHAVDRWQDRYAPGVMWADARIALQALAQDAVRLNDGATPGRDLYMHPAWPTLRFVVARATPGRLPALITVVDAEPLMGALRQSRNLKRERR